ncbi:hypothetical protein L209DRAFT_585743 [Thermothelomyces heterothallicus CBS 203.75]
MNQGRHHFRAMPPTGYFETVACCVYSVISSTQEQYFRQVSKSPYSDPRQIYTGSSVPLRSWWAHHPKDWSPPVGLPTTVVWLRGCEGGQMLSDALISSLLIVRLSIRKQHWCAGLASSIKRDASLYSSDMRGACFIQPPSQRTKDPHASIRKMPRNNVTVKSNGICDGSIAP